MLSQAVGIDLGTTNSCVTFFKNGKVEIIENKGNRITPSVVAVTDGERLVGEAATNQFAMNPRNTVFNIKRLIGQKYNDPKVQEDITQLSYNVVDSPSGRAMVEVEYKKERKRFTPEEISAMILADLKKTAENVIGEVKSAVITVPAYFNDSQRQATKDAGTIAGFNVLSVINEPTAAAIAYGLELNNREKKSILVYDLGGGTFDVTILEIEGSIFEVKSTSGDVHLGGEDFDNRMVDYLAKDIKHTYDKDIKMDPRALRRLRTACEKAKTRLSFESRTDISLEALFDGIDYKKSIDSTRFESLCQDLFEKTLETVQDALNGAKKDKAEIDEVVLVGGSTRIPKIQQLISNFFNGKHLSRAINPDEAVAIGAGYCAAILNGYQHECLREVKFEDVAPLSLGTDIIGDIMSTIIERNTKIPTKKSHMYTTTRDDQTMANIRVYEGQRAKASENNLLGSFPLNGILPALRGVPEIEVTFEIDTNGILNVSAIDTSTGSHNKLVIKNEAGRLTKEDIDRMIAGEERYKTFDMDFVERAQARNELMFLIHDVKRAANDTEIAKRTTPTQRRYLEEALREAEDWFKNNTTATKSKYNVYIDDLKMAFEKFNINKESNDINCVD